MSTETPLVLIVDDEPLNVRVLAEVLRDDYRIKVATSGVRALELARDNDRPDAIVLDVIMPQVDGYKVCQTLRQNEYTRDIPIIFVTADTSPTAEIRGLELGAVDYIRKPFLPLAVRARVRTHVELKRRTDLLESLAALDGLTQIPNRRKFDESLETEWRRARRSHRPLGVLLIDVDYFKEYNDAYGHGAGDEALRRIARAVSRVVRRGGDLVARYGGEEFAVILPETDEGGARAVGERMRSAIEALQLPHEASLASQYLSVSVGCFSEVPVLGDATPARLVAMADQMLYAAKRAGRNRVCRAA